MVVDVLFGGHGPLSPFCSRNLIFSLWFVTDFLFSFIYFVSMLMYLRTEQFWTTIDQNEASPKRRVRTFLLDYVRFCVFE